MKIVHDTSTPTPAEARTATRRRCACSALLEVIASKDAARTRCSAWSRRPGCRSRRCTACCSSSRAPGLLQRESDGRHYGTGVRLRRLAENLLLNDSHHGARHAVLRHLVEEVGESCNITALSGSEVVYLDRVETAAPLRFYLHPGSRVPAHCSASGKVFLAQMSAGAAPARCSPMRRSSATPPNTVTDARRGSSEQLERVRDDGYALDDEEFLPGLLCIAVLVPAADRRARTCASRSRRRSMRLSTDKALKRCCRRCSAPPHALSAIDAERRAAAARRRARRRAPERH